MVGRGRPGGRPAGVRLATTTSARRHCSPRCTTPASTRLVLASLDGRLRRGPLRLRRPRRPGAGRRGPSRPWRPGEFENPARSAARRSRWELVPRGRAGSTRAAATPRARSRRSTTRSAWARQAGGASRALRYHNVYGPGMPRDTPYSGVAAMFRSSVERGEAPRVFEDGGQMRDFVHVDDVARANVLALRRGRRGRTRRPRRRTTSAPDAGARSATWRERSRPRAARARGDGGVPARRRAAHRRLAGAGQRRAGVHRPRSRPDEGLARFATEPLRRAELTSW